MLDNTQNTPSIFSHVLKSNVAEMVIVWGKSVIENMTCILDTPVHDKVHFGHISYTGSYPEKKFVCAQNGGYYKGWLDSITTLSEVSTLGIRWVFK